MNIEKVQDHYKTKFHNIFVKHFLPLTGGYDIQKDYQCMHRLIYGGNKISPQELKFALLTQKEYLIPLKHMLQSYQIFDIQQINIEYGLGYVISFNLEKNISNLKTKQSNTVYQKQIKQTIINCYRALKN